MGREADSLKPSMTSLPLDQNLHRYQQIITDRTDRAKSRMLHLNQYLQSNKDEYGLPLHSNKERYLMFNDQVYQSEARRKAEEREINDIEKRASTKRAQHLGLGQQIQYHNDQKKNEIGMK